MTNFENGRKLLKTANEYVEKMDLSYSKKSWNLVVRHAQEVVELSLKSLLKLMGVDYPKDHDVAGVFAETVKQRGLKVDEKFLEEIKNISSWLTKQRAPAFYYEEEYTEEQAERAKSDAEKVIDFVNKLWKELGKQGAW